MEKSRFIVDFQVTGICNMACNFCDGALKYMKGASLENIQGSIRKLADIGLETLVISGGEPLIRKDIFEIIKCGYEQGLEVYLSTNGILLPKIYPRIKDYLKCLGLPLDGSSREMNSKMTRNPRQYDATTNMLRYFKENHPTHTVKVGTVVSKINKEDLSSTAEVLFNSKDLSLPDVWRLYQFTPIGDGLFSRNIHYISDEEFDKITKKLIDHYPDKYITTLTNEDSNDSYIFINPDLDIEMLTDDVYIKVGNMKDITIEELNILKQEHIDVIDKGSGNRVWLDKDAK